MKNFIKILKEKFKRNNDDFLDAEQAYQKSKYQEQFTKEELKEKIIDNLKRNIKTDIRIKHRYINISTYQDYRSKSVLPEVVKYFIDKNYKVELKNDQDYEEVNVLIINWQGRKDFKD